MKKMGLTFVMLLIVLLCSCKDTPESGIVISKGLNDVIAQQGTEQMGTKEEILQPSFPNKWEATYEDFDGRFKMVIDAEVITYNVSEYPIASIKPYYIPIDQANSIIENLFGTRQVFLHSHILLRNN